MKKYSVLNYFLVVCFFGTYISAQTVRNTDFSPDKTLKSNARVNPSTHAMDLSIPIVGFPGRAGNSMSASFNYTSKTWTTKSFLKPVYGGWVTEVEPYFAQRSAAGWTSTLASPWIEYPSDKYFGSVYGFDYEGEPYGGTPPDLVENFPLFYIKRMRVMMPDGSSHEFRASDTPIVGGSTLGGFTPDYTGTYLSVDNSRMRLEMSASPTTLYMPDGSRYQWGSGNNGFATAYIDVHGNKMTYSDSTKQWIDTMGRVLDNPLPANRTYTQAQTVGEQEIEIPGFDGESYTAATLSWRNLKHATSTDPDDSGLGNLSLDLAYKANYYCAPATHSSISGTHLFSGTDYRMRTCNYGASAPGPVFNPVVLTKITLANGQSYQFKYNLYGEIEKIIYPTGGYERFVYAFTGPIQVSKFPYDQVNRGVIDRYVSEKGDGTDEAHWNYSTGVTMPDGSKTQQFIYREEDPEVHRPYGFDDAKTGLPYETRAYASGNVLLARTLTEYTSTEAPTGQYGDLIATRDVRPTKEVSITFEPGNSNALATMTETVYDTTGHSDPAYFSSLNPKQSKTYHYVVVNASTAASANITTAAGWFAAATPATVTEMDYLYDANYKARNINGLVTETRVEDANGNVKAKTQITYDGLSLLSEPTSTRWENPNTNYRGLVTKTRSWHDIANNLYIDTQAQYDLMGNLRYSWDGNGNLSQVEYSSTYDHAYPTKTISPDPDGAGAITPLETTVLYDYNTGLPTSTTDANGQTTQMEYNDPLLRPTRVIAPNGHQTITEYGAGTSESTRFVKSRSQIDETNWKEAYSWFDGLGRTIKSQSVDSAGDVFTETEYDNMGRAKRSTNPFRLGETPLWTTNTFDTAGRPWKVTTPDGAVAETTYGLATTGSQIGSAVTVTDQAGKHRRNISDALGQLIRVDEPNASNQLGTVASPNQPTYYSYNTLGKMVKVNQGVQYRYFMYDSLGRMLRVHQPEQEINTNLNTSGNPDNNSWSAGFTYDNNSNVLTATDAENTTITSTYDALNRALTTTYSDGTPTVTNYYDGTGLPSVPANSKGRLTKVSSSISESRYTEFDVVGRLKQYQQITDGQTYTSKYTYNLSGALVEEEYPSGRKVRNDFDADGQLSKVDSKKAGTDVYRPFVSNFAYNAAGMASQMRYGNGRWETAKFNSRLQAIELGLGNSVTDASVWKTSYEYGELQTNGTVDTIKNSGNIAKQTLTVPGTNFVQSYKYDSVYRLTEAVEKTGTTQNWIQQFGYDRYGNRTSFSQNIGGITNNTTPAVDANTNRFTSTDFAYDKNGNIVEDTDSITSLPREFIFNGDNKQTEVKRDGVTIGRYFYDGEGKRVKKITDTETTVFVYSGGKLIAEYSTQLSQTPSTSYLTNDHLGSPRVVTDELGQVKSRRDFMPFGEELYVNVGGRTPNLEYGSSEDDVRQKFTGYQKDDETNLDFAEARMYQNLYGRFTAIDPLLASGKSADPQSFNRYVYVRNSPLVMTDPSGLCDSNQDGTKSNCPKNHYGTVYTKTVDGQVRYNNQNLDGSWGVFKGDASFTRKDTGVRMVVNEFGWYETPASTTGSSSAGGDPRVSALLGGFSQGYSDVKTGTARGIGNTGIDLVNGVTGLIWSGTAQGQFAPNPLQIERYNYDSLRQATWGTAFQTGLTVAPGVVGGVFAGGSASLSVVPAAENAPQMGRGAQVVTEWLGPGAEPVKSGSDLMIRSADGARSIRFDLINSHGDLPHINIQTWRNTPRGWIETSPNVHIYPK